MLDENLSFHENYQSDILQVLDKEEKTFDQLLEEFDYGDVNPLNDFNTLELDDLPLNDSIEFNTFQSKPADHQTTVSTNNVSAIPIIQPTKPKLQRRMKTINFMDDKISLKDKEMVEMRDLVHKEIQESIKNVHLNQITSSRSLFIKNLSKHILPSRKSQLPNPIEFPVKLTNRWIELTRNITNHSYDMNENDDSSFHVEKKRRLTLSKLDTSPAIEHSNFYGQDLSPVEIARAAESDPVQSFEVMPCGSSQMNFSDPFLESPILGNPFLDIDSNQDEQTPYIFEDQSQLDEECKSFLEFIQSIMYEADSNSVLTLKTRNAIEVVQLNPMEDIQISLV
ncbi:hypothetical protein HDV02_004301 [Globomyces sp. JEL0801]|nr:hypothetical protein HDV02_004301 [Globomyces sp. JEL0801]